MMIMETQLGSVCTLIISGFLSMKSLLLWFKSRPLTVILLLVIAYLLLNQNNPSPLLQNSVSKSSIGRSAVSLDYAGEKMVSSIAPLPEAGGGYAPVDSDIRKVITRTNLSMLVKDVPETVTKIETIVKTNQGFMVDTSLTLPEGAASGHLSLRVPEANRATTVAEIKKLGVKVTSENVSGNDVTDQYVDLEARLLTLNATKAKFEAILNSAIKVSDILEVQRELISLQSQIDNLKGQQQYLDQSANLSLITLNLSTDELALPYAPDEAWRPALIFKEAVRSLIGIARQIGNLFIWLAVFSPIWLILLAVYLILKRRRPTKSI